MKAELNLSPFGLDSKVIIDGYNVASAVRGLTLRSKVGESTTLELDLVLHEWGWADGEVGVALPPATHEALLALGWTPPDQ